jgi:alpha/beta superfamily hydrolase
LMGLSFASEISGGGNTMDMGKNSVSTAAGGGNGAMLGGNGTARAGWFGPADRPLFGWFHVPADGLARAGVVLCPPIGVEGRVSYATFRTLAERLVAAGFAVLRFDYEGTGDSAGAFGEPDRTDSWLASIACARETMRHHGAKEIAVVGMRIGATLAAIDASRREPLDALVMWDPCGSGRAFLRQQVMLNGLGVGDDEVTDGSVVTAGYVFRPDTAEALSALSIAALEPQPAKRTLLLTRPDRPRDRSLRDLLSAPDTDRQDALGQAELLDVASLLDQVPYETVDAIERWLSGVFPERLTSIDVPDRTWQSAVVGRDRNNRAVVEHVVHLGPLELFGIVTAPEEWEVGPTVIFLNDGHDHRTGSARVWVDLGRRLAADGFRTLRFDLSGIGDSPTRPGLSERQSRAPELIDDLLDVASAACPADPSNTVFVGQCSGGYHALEAGLALIPRGVCAVNPILTWAPPEILAGQPMDPRRHAQFPLPKRLRELESSHASATHRIWSLYTQFMVQKSPMRAPATLARQGVNTLLVCAPEDDQQFDGPLYWRRVWRRLIRSGALQRRSIVGLDHGFAARQPREELLDVLAEHIGATFGRRAARTDSLRHLASSPSEPDPRAHRLDR